MSKSITTPKSVKLTAADLRDLQALGNGALMIRNMVGVRIGSLLSISIKQRKSSVARLNKFIKAGYVKTREHTVLQDTFIITAAGRAELEAYERHLEENEMSVGIVHGEYCNGLRNLAFDIRTESNDEAVS